MVDTVGIVEVEVVADGRPLGKALRLAGQEAGHGAGKGFTDKFNKQLKKDLQKSSARESIRRALRPQLNKAGEDLAKILRSGLSDKAKRVNVTRLLGLHDPQVKKDIEKIARQHGVSAEEAGRLWLREIGSAFTDIQRRADRINFDLDIGEAGDKIKADLDRALREAGREGGKTFQEALADGFDDDRYDSTFRRIADKWGKTTEEIKRLTIKNIGGGLKEAHREGARDFTSEYDKALDEIGRKIDKDFGEKLRRSHRHSASEYKRVWGNALDKVGDEVDGLATRFGVASDKISRRLRNDIDVQVRRTNRGFFRTSSLLDGVGIKGATAFGRIFSVLTSGGKIIANAVREFGRLKDQLGGTFKALRQVGSQGFASIARLGPALARMAPLIGAVGAAASAAVVGIGGLVGGLVALAGSAGTAALALGGVLAPALLGLGGLFAGVLLGMDQIKELAGEVTTAFKEWGDYIGQSFITEIRPALRDFLESEVEPIAEGIHDIVHETSEGIADLITQLKQVDIGDILSGIAPAAGRLTDAFSGFVVGFLEFARTATPALEVFAEHAVSLSETFKEWAIDEDGELSAFLVNGIEHLKAWGTLLGEIVDFIGNVFGGSTAEAGKGFVENLSKIVGLWNEWLESEEGTAVMAELFGFVSDALSAIAPLMPALVTAFAALFTPEGIQATESMVLALAEILPLVANLLGLLVDTGVIDAFALALGLTAAALNFAVIGLRKLITGIRDFLGPVDSAIDGVQGFLGAFSKLNRGLTLENTFDSFTGASDAVDEALGGITGSFEDFAEGWDDFWAGAGDTVSGAADSFDGLGGSIVDSLSGVVSDVSGLFDGLGGDISDSLSGLASDVGGLFDGIGIDIGGSFDDATTAVTGFVDDTSEMLGDWASGLSQLVSDTADSMKESFAGLGLGEGLSDFGVELTGELAYWRDEVLEFRDIFVEMAAEIGGLFGDLIGSPLENARNNFGLLADEIQFRVGGALDALEEKLPFLDFDDPIGNARNNFGLLVDDIQYKLGGALDSLVELFPDLSGPLEIAQNNIGLFVDEVQFQWDGLWRGAGNGLGIFVDGVQFSFDVLSSFISEWAEEIGVTVATWLDPFAYKVGETVATVREAFTTLTADLGIKFDEMQVRIATALTSVQTKVSEVTGFISQKFTVLTSGITDLWNQALTSVTGVLNSIRTRVSSLGASVAATFDGIYSKASGTFNRIRGLVNNVVGSIRGAFSGLTGSIGNVFAGIYAKIKYWVDLIQAKLRGITNSIRSVRSSIPGAKAGALVMGPQTLRVGEAGPEAVIPLTRPLAMVDKSVRGMAATLRGLDGGGGGVGATAGKVVNNSVVVNARSEQPETVANQVVNRIAAMAG